MLKFNELKQKRAITLVALILTIIVMLILVGVSVSVLINSDLIGTAQNAGDRTETAYGEEGQMGQITVGNKTYASIEDYLAGNEMPEWETIFKGSVTTEDGQAFLSENILFSTDYIYRLTVASDEYTWQVIANPIFVDNQEGMELYILSAIADGEVLTFATSAQADQKLSALDSYTGIAGINIAETGSMIMFESITEETSEDINEYTITKIEQKSKKSNSSNIKIALSITNNPVTPTLTNGNTIYTDRNGKTAVIPAGFTVSGVSTEQTIDGGLVIYEIPENGTVDWTNTNINMQESYNQFVWVPVLQNQTIKIAVESKKNIIAIGIEDEILNGITTDINNKEIIASGKKYNGEVYPTINGTYKITVITEEGEIRTDTIDVTSLYAQDFYIYDQIPKMIRDMEITAETFGTTLEEYIALLGIASIDELPTVLTVQYKDFTDPTMPTYLDSVNKYGGFYIARYEAGSANERTYEEPETLTLTPVLSKKNQYPYNLISQTEAITQSESMYSSVSTPAITTVTSTLINGAAWDRTLNWLLETKVVTQEQVIIDSTSWGNYLDSEFKFTGKYLEYVGGYFHTFQETTTSMDKIKNGTSDKYYLLGTGVTEYTKRNNIYDLAGNCDEWTTEMKSPDIEVSRGGFYGNAGSDYPISYRHVSGPDYSGYGDPTFRPTLYIN